MVSQIPYLFWNKRHRFLTLERKYLEVFIRDKSRISKASKLIMGDIFRFIPSCDPRKIGVRVRFIEVVDCKLNIDILLVNGSRNATYVIYMCQ